MQESKVEEELFFEVVKHLSFGHEQGRWEFVCVLPLKLLLSPRMLLLFFLFLIFVCYYFFSWAVGLYASQKGIIMCILCVCLCVLVVFGCLKKEENKYNLFVFGKNPNKGTRMKCFQKKKK